MINENKVRVGNFNSSEIVALTADITDAARKRGEILAKPAHTFIEECNIERRLGKSISTESNAKPLLWGKVMEGFVFNAVGLEYSISSQETDVHPTIDYWVGSKDGLKHDEGKTVIDFKCPFTLKSFCQLVQPIYDGLNGMDAMNVIRAKHKDGEKFFWQLVSNAIINDCKFAELIVFMPYASELAEVKLLADGNATLYWLAMARDNELPFLEDGGYYKNLNIIRFEVRQEDKDFLTEKVKSAGKYLIEKPTIQP